MELRHLRYFVVVAEEGHFTRAALRLGMQQPPLSQQIRALEQELGLTLFRRHPKGADLTVAGAVFLKEAIAILASINTAAMRATRAANGADGRLSIGFTSSAAAHALIPRLVRAFRTPYPKVDLHFQEGNAVELTEAVSKGELQVGFLRQPVARPPSLKFVELLHEEMLLVLPTRHPALATYKGRGMPVIELAALREESFILVRRTGAPGMYSNLINACMKAGFAPNITIEVDRMLTNISLVAAGAGVSAVPASMRGFHEGSVVYCRIANTDSELGAPLTMMYNDNDASPTLANFIAQSDIIVQALHAAKAL